MARYIVDELEVMIVEEAVSRTPREPTPAERAALEKYFARPTSRDATGRLYRLYGEVVEGIDGLVLMYPATSADTGPGRTRAE